MTSSESMFPVELASDSELVAACAGGDREAFGRIVERYQRLLCSLAYSATGSLSESEDIAQETFLAAWQQLHDLRDHAKLRAWLCGILRHMIGRRRRRDGREPVRNAGTLEVAGDLASPATPTPDLAMQREEQAILWSELARVPELYREPLILYYREHRSVENVASALELSVDAVKQRLARGRRILQERVLAFVERTLAQSTPGRVFTASVVAALPPTLAVPAKAAGVATAAAHGGVLAKTTGFAALLSSASGVFAAVFTLRTSLDQARTPRERRGVVKVTLGCFFGCLGLYVALWLLRTAALRWPGLQSLLAAVDQALVLGFLAFWPLFLWRMMRRFRRLRSAERLAQPQLFADRRDQTGAAAAEYRSRTALFGVPLVHFRFAAPNDGQRPVFGWIAGGDRAYGLLFAWGGLALAPISIGACAVGLLAIGTQGVGLYGIGGFGVGLVGVGCAAVGFKAYAWLSALGWDTAQSGAGFAIARGAAVGPIAIAPNANDAVAQALLANPDAERHQMTFLLVVALVSLVPVVWYARAVRRRLGRAGPADPAARS